MRVFKLLSRFFIYGLFVMGLVACQSTKDKSMQVNSLQAENKHIEGDRAQLGKTPTVQESKVKQLEHQQEILIAENKRIHESKDALEKAVQTLNQKLSREIENKQALLTQHDSSQSIQLTLQQAVLFPSSSYTLSLEGKHVLAKVALALKNLNISEDQQIRIVGHSDNMPVMKKWHTQFMDNWDLSARRAAAIARYIIWGHGVPAHQVVVVGKADTAPVVSNDTKEGRAKNRRIELFVEPKRQ